MRRGSWYFEDGYRELSCLVVIMIIKAKALLFQLSGQQDWHIGLEMDFFGSI